MTARKFPTTSETTMADSKDGQQAVMLITTIISFPFALEGQGVPLKVGDLRRMMGVLEAADIPDTAPIAVIYNDEQGFGFRVGD